MRQRMCSKTLIASGGEAARRSVPIITRRKGKGKKKHIPLLPKEGCAGKQEETPLCFASLDDLAARRAADRTDEIVWNVLSQPDIAAYRAFPARVRG